MRAPLVFFPDARPCNFKLSAATLWASLLLPRQAQREKGGTKKKKEGGLKWKRPQQAEKTVRKPQGEENSFLVFKWATTLQSSSQASLHYYCIHPFFASVTLQELLFTALIGRLVVFRWFAFLLTVTQSVLFNGAFQDGKRIGSYGWLWSYVNTFVQAGTSDSCALTCKIVDICAL